MNKFQKITTNITRCTYLPDTVTEISNSSFFIDSNLMTGETVLNCPLDIIDVSFEKRDIYRYVANGLPEVKIHKTVDGERTYIANLEKKFDRTAYRAKMTFKLADDEYIYGLGQDEDGVYNKRNHRRGFCYIATT